MANSDYAGASSRGKTLALERYQSYLRDADSGRYKTGIRKEWQLPLLCNNWGYCLNLQSTVIYERKLLSRTENNAYVASK